jgi:hypothetical protein
MLGPMGYDQLTFHRALHSFGRQLLTILCEPLYKKLFERNKI